MTPKPLGAEQMNEDDGTIMFSLDHEPARLLPYRKKMRTFLAFLKEPFKVDTQEGPRSIGPETVDDWDGGYYIAYPGNGSKPYAVSPKFVRDNYELD